MFYESYYPKKELKTISKELEDFSKRFLLHDNWCYKLEKNCFIGFYFIRKLLESRYKVTDSIKKTELTINSYKFIGSKSVFLPRGEEKDYDYKTPSKEKLEIRDISHQFVHSQIFFGAKEGKGLKYIYVSSDYMIYKKIYEFKIEDIIKIFKSFSNNQVTNINSSIDKNGNVKTQCD